MGYRYIGSKLRIVDEIIKVVGAPQKNGFFIDGFSGTGCVAQQAAANGWNVKINDLLLCAVVMTTAGLLSTKDVSFKHFGGYDKAIAELNHIRANRGYFWREYSPASKQFGKPERKYFTEANAKKIDGMANAIHKWYNEKIITKNEFFLLLADLISSTNEIANIAGTYGCFLSKWTDQSEREISLNPRELRKSKISFEISNKNVFDLDSSINDTIYFDPPYTKRQYASYYHILESIVQGDRPEVTGVAGLRPWKEKASVFCYKTKAHKALVELISKQKAGRVILSYSDEGHVNLDKLSEDLNDFGNIDIIEVKQINRYTPNKAALSNNSIVKEYLLDFKRTI